MYEGGKLDNAGAPSGAMKKPTNSLLNSLGGMEVKLNQLEVKVEQIACSQTEVLRRLDMVCQGMGKLEKDLDQLRKDRDPQAGDRGSRGGGGDPALFSEVRVMCGETVALLKNLQQEGKWQREKIEGIESSVSAVDKLWGYVGEVFRSSKIVEFILKGIVPWRKQGLLYIQEEEEVSELMLKRAGDKKAVELPVKEAKAADHGVEVPTPPEPDPCRLSESLTEGPAVEEAIFPSTNSDRGSKGSRKPKEVTLKSREPTRVQTFAPDVVVAQVEVTIEVLSELRSAKQVPMGSYYAVKPNAVLGGGRFGQVHKCAELSSGLILAAKLIKVKGMRERDEVKNEIGVMNQLNHVNLIQLYDAFESRTNLTLIMEYVDGGELFDRIVDENYQLTELDAIVFMRQICEGVQYLHQQYILHLDLKPENILCVNSTGNQIKIIDFGLARKYRPREKLKVNFGTPEFLAPEVVNYDFVSFPTDMWSVGVITYMLLSGLSPFLGDNDAETMNNILHANWDFDSEAFENVTEEAKDFVTRLLIPTKCSRLSATGCMKHAWLNNLEDKAKLHQVRLKSQVKLQRYLAAHKQWKKHFYVVAAANRLKRFRQNHPINTV
uniref:Protein kinase domain-containing protein n=1 Tax=Oncorhynchus tshawytscha TaxID=74940 RepID=A0A8C8H9I8_ONCTS